MNVLTRRITLGLLGIGATMLGAAAHGQAFADDFEGYTVGQGIVGQNGWEEWCGSFGVDVTVSDTFARSGTKSIYGQPDDDIVQRIGATSGIWTISVWTYVPSSFTGSGYVIVMNEYPDLNCVGTFDWSGQVNLNAGTGMCIAESQGLGGSTPLIRDQWVEVLYVVDLDNNVHDVYYGTTKIVDQLPWDDDQTFSIAALDLYAAPNGEYYFDDVNIEPVITETELCPASYTAVRGLLVGGTLGNLCGSDNAYLTHRPDVFRTSAVPPVQIQMDFTSPTETPSELRVHVESAANANNIAQRTLIWNNDTQTYDLLNTRNLSQTDSSIDLVINTNPGRYVQSGTGRIRLLVQANALAFTIAPVWQHRLDDVVVTVVN